MKSILLFGALSLLTIQITYSQWVTQNSNTISDLNDIDFYNEDFGVAVGAAGTVVITTDGGNTWSIFTSPTTQDLLDVSILNPDTFFASNGIADVQNLYRYTSSGGWATVLTDGLPFKSTVINSDAYAVSNHIYHSVNGGTNWNSQYDVSSTTVYTSIKFTNEETGCVGGNVSGFQSYSAFMVRTVNAGNLWWNFDAASFPNSNGLSTFDFPTKDTGFIFAPYYHLFDVTDSCQIWRVTNFSLGPDLNPEDSLWFFSSSVLVQTFHDYISACKFFGTDTGYAVGNKGIIYKTTDGGFNWNNDYEETQSLNGLKMINSTLGYAVGKSGTILKREFGTLVGNENEFGVDYSVFPNPASSTVTLNWNSKNTGNISIYILDALGQEVFQEKNIQSKSGENSRILDVSPLLNGIYFIRLQDGLSSSILKLNVLK